ncbi:hypothetical protein [Micromonospora echinospora]|uniref:hypothetical protein n=1 Tax=Micromonospora echinospora TaxID=1877 RepID=UPI003A835DC5
MRTAGQRVHPYVIRLRLDELPAADPSADHRYATGPEQGGGGLVRLTVQHQVQVRAQRVGEAVGVGESTGSGRAVRPVVQHADP